MRTVCDAGSGAGRERRAIALLSGAFSEPEDFVREGFPAALRAHGIEAPVTMAPVRMAWLADGSVVERIRRSVVAPARASGVQRVWLAGISIGALAALSYAARHETDVGGLVLISPYPATRELLREIADAGGPAHWRPVVPPGGDLEREAWQWLLARGPERLPVHCCFASGDRFVEGQRLMASTLAAARVHERPGGHDWPAWRALWGDFLARSKSELQ